MLTILGVDNTEDHQVAIELLARLKFKDLRLRLVHVLERLQPPGWDLPLKEPADLIENVLRMQEAEGRKALDEAAAALQKHGISSHSKMLNGFAANQLMDDAEQIGADLIAVGSEHKGKVEAFLIGGVARKLVIGAEQSILVAKKMPKREGPLTVVLATDHSDYANRCVDRLVQWAPQGIGRLILLTAYPKGLIRSMRGMLEHFKIDISAWVEEKLHEHNRQVLEKLAPLGWNCESSVIDAPPNEAINQVMQKNGADLLIVGAHGHGIVERVTIGSVSFHQVVAEAHNVLVLRA